MKDYSQSGEQKYILDALLGVDGGRFLDIGAFNPEVFSNTRALFELGWNGVMFEPSPGPSLALVKAYGFEQRITLVQAAVGFETGLLRLMVTDDAVSTSKEKGYELWNRATQFHGELLVPQVTLEQIYTQFGAFDFVNIDAEGMSCDLFVRAIELQWRPQVWCVELDEAPDGKDRLREVQAIAGGADYRTEYVNDGNIILVKR